jgi:hypothetical protein
MINAGTVVQTASLRGNKIDRVIREMQIEVSLYIDATFLPQHYTAVSDQLHAPTALNLAKVSLIPNGY